MSATISRGQLRIARVLSGLAAAFIHREHWPSWEGESEIRQIFDPSDFPAG